jgi:uncharacterized cysteine cluster protein YcgN (CxxCxxCC family)
MKCVFIPKLKKLIESLLSLFQCVYSKIKETNKIFVKSISKSKKLLRCNLTKINKCQMKEQRNRSRIYLTQHNIRHVSWIGNFCIKLEALDVFGYNI